MVRVGGSVILAKDVQPSKASRAILVVPFGTVPSGPSGCSSSSRLCVATHRGLHRSTRRSFKSGSCVGRKPRDQRCRNVAADTDEGKWEGEGGGSPGASLCGKRKTRRGQASGCGVVPGPEGGGMEGIERWRVCKLTSTY